MKTILLVRRRDALLLGIIYDYYSIGASISEYWHGEVPDLLEGVSG